MWRNPESSSLCNRAISIKAILYWAEIELPSPLEAQDSKLAGEAGTQPTLRLPPLRDGRHNRLFSAAVGLKTDPDNINCLEPGSGFLFLDGGRDGHLNQRVTKANDPT